MSTDQPTSAGAPLLRAGGEAAGASGLQRRVLSMPDVLAQSVATAAPSSAMSVVALLVFLSAGNGTWVSFVIALLLMLSVGYCVTHFARRLNSAGSFYIWVCQGLGADAGWAAGWGLALGYLVLAFAGPFGFSAFASDFLTRIGLPADNIWSWAILCAVDFAVATFVAIRGIAISARTSLILESISVSIILALCVIIWVHKGTVFSMPQLRLQGATVGGIVVGVVLGIFSFVGFESAGVLGLEARNPYRAVGQAILGSALVVGLFYVVVSYSQVFGFQGTSPGFAKSQAPLPELAAIVGLPWLGLVIDLGIVCSMFAVTLASINAAARMLLTLSHDGLGVRALTRIHPRFRTPHVAIGAVAVPLFLVPVLMTLISRVPPIDQIAWAGTLSTFGFMLAYVLVSIAAPVFLARLGRFWAVTGVVGLIGALVMAFVFWTSWLPQIIPGGLFPPLTGSSLALPYIFFAWLAIGLVWYLVLRIRRPDQARLVGARFEAETSDR